MVFYKGAVSYKDFESMTIPEIINLRNHADKINKEIDKAHKKQSK
jgi:hypothetical protein